MNHLLSDRVINMAESETLKMAQMARDLKALGHDVISLSLGEPDFDTPDSIKEAAWEALKAGVTKYTPVPGLQELREAIAQKLREENKLNYIASQIVVSNGAKQSISNICQAMLNPGDEVIVFAPYWVSYFEIIKLAGGTPVIISGDIDAEYKVTAQQLKNAITDKTKLVLFSSPCNPTGTVFNREDLESYAEILRKHPDIYIISDEIYEYIVFGEEHISIGSLEGMIDQTITVNGFSKSYSMTGWRLGYMAAPDFIAKACIKIQGQFTSGANSFSQKAGVYAIQHGKAEALVMRDAFARRRDLVIRLLEEIPGIKVNHPEGAFYVFPDVSALYGKSSDGTVIKTADDFCDLLMSKAYVGLVAGSAFGAPDCFRLSYAASDAQLIEAISRIKRVVEGLAGIRNSRF
ncbi:MAG: pyridoxal phosphate-dependent aminotransferase [Saprospiraceae bacterium]|nr:pyridoxal phosphate-dependent aminotransferase [Saprospiraceae bacterium]